MLKKSIFPMSIIILSLAGLLFSYILAEEFHFINVPKFKDSSPGIFYKVSSQVCGDEGTYFSCANVAKSPYANAFGIPVAIYGVCFFLVVFLTALGFVFAPKTFKPAIGMGLFWYAILGVLIDIGLLIISIVHIKAICPFCLGTYITNLIIFIIVIGYLIKNRINPVRVISRFKAIELPIKKLAFLLFALGIAVIVAASAGISYGINQFLITSRINYIKDNKDKEIELIVDDFSNEKESDIDPTAFYVYGDPEAPVTITEFSDFLCPYCAFAYTIMDQLVRDNPGKIKVMFVNYPLDISCNHHMRRAMHKGSCELAKGAICAAQQGVLADYQKVAFEARKHGLTVQDLNTILIRSGVSTHEFYQCIGDPDTEDTLQQQIKQATDYGINATPTIYINKKKFKGRLYIEALQKIIDLEYTRATAK